MTAKVKIRLAMLSDFEGIAAVCERNGMPIASRTEWEQPWTTYPFRDEFEGIPMGWVMEDENGEIAGTISNLYFVYEWSGQRLRVAAAGNWAVDLAYRSSSLLLGAQFFGQKGLDLLINGSASQVASQLMPLYKAQKIPSPGYDQSLLWILSPRRVAVSALARRGIPGGALLGLPAGAALWAGDVWKRSGRQSIRSRILEVTRIDDRFDEFWQRRSRTAKHLIAVRTRALLDWRFGQRMRSGKAAIIALEDEGGMAGYMILIRRDRAGLKNLQLADLQVLTDNPVHVQDLILAGLDHARSAGVDIVEMQGFNEFKRTAALALNPHRHQYPAWQTFYKVLNPVLATPLADRTNWDASPFDSD